MATQTNIPKYKVIKKLGAGNFGAAYICVETGTTEPEYVLKMSNLDGLNEHDKKQAIGEAELLKTLESPCIVKYIDSFVENKTLVIVMEHCDGGDLETLIETRKKNNKPFEEKEIRHVLVQIAIALSHCHAKNIVHRDIKTSNVFLLKDGSVKLGDFGVSTQMKDSSSKAETRLGTPYYLSPEIVAGEPYDCKTDIWALGCILYEMMNLKKPFEQEGILPLMRAISVAEYEPLSPNYSAELRELTALMLAKNAQHRPTSQQVLERVAFDEQFGAPPKKKQFNQVADLEAELEKELDKLEAKHMKEIGELLN